MTTPRDTSSNAHESFREAAQFSFEDAQLGRLKYHLLRLTSAGLTDQDVQDLAELGRLAFNDADVAPQAERITQRADASPPASALAEIVAQADGGGRPRSPRALMFGAVLGAYTALGAQSADDRLSAAILGAIGGAVALSTSTFVGDHVTRAAWSSYLAMDD